MCKKKKVPFLVQEKKMPALILQGVFEKSVK